MRIALVVGCAKGVWEEVEAARKLFPVVSAENVYCVKMAGIDWPDRFRSWVTLHPEFMERYRAERRKLALPDPVEVVGPLESECGEHFRHKVDRRVSYRWKGMTSSGSSGLFGVKIALDDGHDKVVLAGVPMSAEKGHYRRGHDDWAQRDAFVRGWEAAMPHIGGRVKSPSGWTREILGEPTPEWLAA